MLNQCAVSIVYPGTSLSPDLFQPRISAIGTIWDFSTQNVLGPKTLVLLGIFFQHGWHQPRRDQKRERRSGTYSAS